MSYKNFNKDLPASIRNENDISNKFLEFYGWKTLGRGGKSNKFDLLIQTNKRQIKVEAKQDFTCKKTGNVGLEYHCRGKPSGINVTESDYYVYTIHRKNEIVFRIAKTEVLKYMVENNLYHRWVNGGDKGSDSLNYLFTYNVFCTGSSRIFFEKGTPKIE